MENVDFLSRLRVLAIFGLTRKNHVKEAPSFSLAFEAIVALKALGEAKASDIVQKHKMRPTQIYLWKNQLLEGSEDVFQDGRSKEAKPSSDEPECTELYERIGR